MRQFLRPSTIHERMIANLKRGRVALWNTPHFHRQLKRHLKLCSHCKDLLLDAMLDASTTNPAR